MKRVKKKTRAKGAPAPLLVKPLYNIGELAKIMGTSRHLTRRYLETYDVPIRRAGRFDVVHLSHISENCRDLLRSIEEAERLRELARIMAGDPVSE
jgi:hypothetical protein